MLGHCPTKFSGYGHCGDEDIMIFVCQMTLQNRLAKRSGNFLGWSHSL